MTNVLGIVAEYNPFHNGHLYHLQKSKELTNSEFTICIIGGNFSQRGDTSIVDKWTKTEMALNNGIDLVIELPTIYNISSAENFADGAIKILDSLKIVDFVSFGSEVGNINTLDNIAKVLVDEPKEYITMLNHELNTGNSFPKAREKALMLYLNDIRRYTNVLSEPNNILGIEYLKALRKQNSLIRGVTITREKAGHNDTKYKNNFASATAIRDYIYNKKFNEISHTMPANVSSMLRMKIDRGEIITSLKAYEREIVYTLRKMSIAEISELPDVSEGLENTIKTAANTYNNLEDIISLIKSKRYTYTRICRILLYALLNITKKDMKLSMKEQPYIRVLGFNKNGEFLLSEIANQNPKLPIITSVKKFIDTNNNKNLQRLLDIDIFATNVYTLGYEYNSLCNLDYTKSIIKK